MTNWADSRSVFSLTSLVQRIQALEDWRESMICCEDCERYADRRSAHDMDHGIYYCDPCYKRRQVAGEGF